MTDDRLTKVKAEIERRKKLHEKSLINPIHEGFGLQKVIESKISELTYLLSFIDSMQEEPTIPDIVDEHYWEMLGEEPVSENLEEAIGEYCSNPDNFISYVDTGFAYRSEQKDDIPLIIKAIRFGANWQKHKDESYTKSMYKVGINTGKELMEQQMMAKAIRGHVGQTINGMLRALSDETFGDMGFTAGDKVKLIILKEG